MIKKSCNFVEMSRFFKYLLLVVFSVFLSSQINASSTFFSIEKSSVSVVDLGKAVVNSLDDLAKNYPKLFKSLPDDATKLRFIDDFSKDVSLLKQLDETPGLVNGWKRLDALDVNDVLRKNPEILDYVGNGRKSEINIDVEEVLGGHSKYRHGSHLTDLEMKQRVLGTHPNFPQSRSGLKFESDVIHRDAVNKAFKEHKSTIKSHFSSSDDYLELEFDYGSKVGSGYTNSGTRRNPVTSYVESNKIKIALKRDITNPDGFILDSAYPSFN